MVPKTDSPPTDRATTRPLSWLVLGLVLLATAGCSVKSLVLPPIATTLARSGTLFSSDEDPELVADALPLALKLLEAVLAEKETADHQELLMATCRSFTQYGFAFVELEAESLALDDYRAAEELRERALKLYLRARRYCFRALELAAPGLKDELTRSLGKAFETYPLDDVPLLYWTAASWGSAISVGLDRPELVVDVPAVRALLKRALTLDETFERGALHDAMITFEALPAHMGGSLERARQHYERALELSGGHRAGTHLLWAAKVSVKNQDREEAERHLHKALAVDVDKLPEEKLANLLVQRRAEELLGELDELILDDLDDPVADGAGN